MNSTYDPERMAVMPRYSDYSPFDEPRYKEIMRNFILSNENNYRSEWAENIMKKLKMKMSE